MNFELVNTEWFSPVALRLPDYKVGRVSYGQGRSYIRINEETGLESPFRLYTSLTTAINTCAPMEKPLLEWYIKHGMQEADRLLKVSQHYGTLMHLLFGKFLMENSFDLGIVKQEIEDYTGSHSYWQPECEQWEEKLKSDIVAFVQFCQDYKVVPIGIEYVLLSNRGFGTLIDLVCLMSIQEDGFDYDNPYKSGPRKGEPREIKVEKQIRAVINFKSGRHQFYRSNGIQALAEKQLFEENFPDIKIDAAYNWAPKEWVNSPSYTLKDWADEISPEEVDSVLKLAEVRFAKAALKKQYTNLFGTIHKSEPVANVIHKQSVEEYCAGKYGNAPKGGAKIKEMYSPAPTKQVYTPSALPI